MSLVAKIDTMGRRTELISVPLCQELTATVGCPAGQVRLTCNGAGEFSVQITDPDADEWQTVCAGALDIQRAVDPRGIE